MRRRLTVRAVLNRLSLEFDLLIWRYRTAALRRRRDFPPATRCILISDLMSTISTVKSEALFAAALRSRGFAPVVLLPGRYRIVERYYRMAGPVEFVYLDSFLDADVSINAQRDADRRLNEDPQLAHLINWEADGYRIGRNVMSRAVRILRVGRIDPSDGKHCETVRQTLIESLATRTACEHILDQVAPEIALFNERGYTPAAEIFDGCLRRGIDAVQWFGAPQSESLAYKRYHSNNRAHHPLSLSDETWRALQKRRWNEKDEHRVLQFLRANYETGAWFNRQQLQEGKAILTADAAKARLGLDPAKKTAVIFCHILYDATFFFGDSLFSDYEAWLVEAVRGAIANPNLNWIVKVHPVNVWRSRMDGQPMEQLEVQAIRAACGTLPDHVKILPADTEINTYTLFDIADYGLTVRGTIGMELPCFGIPVVTAGSGRYSGRGFTIDPETPDTFRAVLASLHTVPKLDQATIHDAQRYLYGSFFLRPLRMDGFLLDFRANSFSSPALVSNVHLDPASAARLEDTTDLRRFCDWMSDGHSEDLLAEDLPESIDLLPCENTEFDAERICP